MYTINRPQQFHYISKAFQLIPGAQYEFSCGE